MLYIRAVGYAAPATQVTSPLFSGFGAAASPWPEFLSRASVLPSDYISIDGNSVPSRSKAIATETPTQLARRATNQALHRAAIQTDEIALVIGDTATPWETTPSEGQRVAGALDLKLPAYDIASAGCFLSTLAYALVSFRSDMLAHTILGISANAPTQAVNFRTDTPRFIFGDGAAAAVFSTQAAPGFKLLDARITCDPVLSDYLVVEHFGHIRIDSRFISEFAYGQTLQILKSECLKRLSNISSIALILPSILGDQAAAIAETLGFSSRQIFHNYASRGYLFGAASLSVMSDFWDEISKFEDVFIIECGAGASSGWVQLKRIK